jgi:hypothetical protein
MADRIKYGILPNPQPDAEGKTTYQVRHMPDGTMSEKGFLAHLEYHNTYNTIMMQSSLSVLKKEIIEQLRDNKRFRIDGIGTFQMKVGLITKYDEEGNPIKPHFTDPDMITANDVEVQGVSFTPDPSFVKALRRKTSTRNKFGRGPAGRNKPYTREQVVKFLDNYLNAQHSITRKQLQYGLNITEYRAQKWLDELMAEPGSKYYCKQQGKTYVYYRHADNAV